MAKKCGTCREEGHNRTTCPNAYVEDVRCKQCGNLYQSRIGHGSVFCSGWCFEYHQAGGIGSPYKQDPGKPREG